jgi:hypothetical protein
MVHDEFNQTAVVKTATMFAAHDPPGSRHHHGTGRSASTAENVVQAALTGHLVPPRSTNDASTGHATIDLAFSRFDLVDAHRHDGAAPRPKICADCKRNRPLLPR